MRPTNPLLTLARAMVLPISSHVISRDPHRGLVFPFFIFMLGAFTIPSTKPDVALAGKPACGSFVCAVSIFDPCKKAERRHEM